MDRKQFRELADPETARETIRSLDLTPDPETVSLREARGRALAERLDAGLDVPWRLYTSDAADASLRVALVGARVQKK